MQETALPLFAEIDYRDSLDIFNVFKDEKWAIFFDSANHQQPFQSTNGYSYIAVDPFIAFCLKDEIFVGEDKTTSDPFAWLRQVSGRFQSEKNPKLPPFQGGIAGYFSYDLCHYLENISLPVIDDMDFPDMAVGIYDTIISFDHRLNKAWIVSTGFPEVELEKRRIRARKRLSRLNQLISRSPSDEPKSEIYVSDVKKPEINTAFTRDEYEKLVIKAKDYILNGDIFEVNLSQRFKTTLPQGFSAFTLYRTMRTVNPSPFSAYLNLGSKKIVSASPERFLSLRENNVEARPIKGTIRRGRTKEEDQQLAECLANSEKDRAENVMIVDLIRNDLSRVCLDDSVTVETLCGLESYPTVHHLVSVVKGQLKEGEDALSLLAAAFPGGSITGAPKVRAMQIISELEVNRRGPYCGSIGYISFTGEMDTSIVIRTFAVSENDLVYHAGGAIVLDSDPSGEYEELLLKSAALSKALGS